MELNLHAIFQQHLMAATTLIATIAVDEGMSGGTGSKIIPQRRILVTKIFQNLRAKYTSKAY